MATATAAKGGLYYGWIIVALAVLGLIAANGIPLTCISLYLQPWSKEFNVPVSQLLLATVPMMLFMGVSSAVIGNLADRKPARMLMSAGLALLAVVMFAVSFASSALHIQLAYALLFPVPVVLATTSVSNPLVSRWFVKRLGLALGITAFGIGVAGIVLPPIVAAVLPDFGWRNLWRAWAAFVALVALPIVFFATRDRPTEREGLHYLTSDGGAAPVGHGHGAGGAGAMKMVDILKQKAFWFIAAVFLPLGFIYIGAMNNLAPLALSRGHPAATAGLMLSTFNLAHVLSTVIMGLLCDKFGNRLPLVILAFSAGAAGVLLGVADSVPLLLLGSALGGFSGGIWTVMPNAAAVEFGAANVGKAFGLFSLILPIHSLLGSVIAKVKESTGSYTGILVALGVACFVGGIIAMFMRERRGGHPNANERQAALHEAAGPAA